MEKHLEAISNSLESSFTAINAAEHGLEKLRKYSIPAKKHHHYIIGTSRCLVITNHCQSSITHRVLVLHPSLRSHWFATTADSDDTAVQEGAISTAETIFKFVAESYLEAPPSPSQTQTVTRTPAVKPAAKSLSFLASACSFQRVTTTITTTTAKHMPHEELADELKQYLSFEAAPTESQEGDREMGEPLAEDILLNPLLWWKVSMSFNLGFRNTSIGHQIHAPKFPIIARMARDYLAIPATSVSVERVFSKSRHICSNLRSSLKEDTVKMALLVKVWIQSGLFEMTPPTIRRRKHGDNGEIVRKITCR